MESPDFLFCFVKSIKVFAMKCSLKTHLLECLILHRNHNITSQHYRNLVIFLSCIRICVLQQQDQGYSTKTELKTGQTKLTRGMKCRWKEVEKHRWVEWKNTGNRTKANDGYPVQVWRKSQQEGNRAKDLLMTGPWQFVCYIYMSCKG